MQIKKAVYDKGCPKCGAGKKCIEDEIYGCDLCKKEINSPRDERNYLEISVFYNGDRDAIRFQFCSWECVFKFLGKIQRTKYKCDYFISLPTLMFDGEKPGYKDFVIALKGARRTLKNAPVQHTTRKARRKAKS